MRNSALQVSGPTKHLALKRLWRVLWLGVLVVICSGNAYAQDGDDTYSADWGPAIGADMPPINSFDHAGVTRQLADLTGEQGLLLFLNRSADW